MNRKIRKDYQMDLKLKEKTDDESSVKKAQAPARTGRSIAELASLSTLSEEELEEANGEVEDGDTYDEYEEDTDENDADMTETEEDGEEAEEEEEPKDKNEPPMEHYGRVFRFEGKPTADDIFRFMFYHTYCSVVGVIAILLLVASVVMAVWSFMDGNIMQGCIFAGVFLFVAINSPIDGESFFHALNSIVIVFQFVQYSGDIIQCNSYVRMAVPENSLSYGQRLL